MLRPRSFWPRRATISVARRAAVATALAALCAGSLPTSASASASTSSGSATATTAAAAQHRDVVTIDYKDPASVVAYWTADDDAKMREGRNTVGPYPSPPREGVITPGGDEQGYAPQPRPYTQSKSSRLTGILFFTDPGGDGSLVPRHCSASVIRSRGRNVILTSAHCFHISSGEGSFERTNELFVPAYDGQAENPQARHPLGLWPVGRAYLLKEFVEGDTSFELDVATAQVYQDPTFSRPLEDVVGDGFQPVETRAGQPLGVVQLLGYPGDTFFPPFYYATMQRCDSHVRTFLPEDPEARDPVWTVNCGLIAGNSGGPLVGGGTATIPVVGVGGSTRGDQTRLRRDTFGVLYDAAGM